jgi:hypothetical protein
VLDPSVPPEIAQRYHELNERFYVSAPHEYFTLRLNSLLAIAADVEELNLNLRGKGLEVANIKFAVHADERVDTSQLSQMATKADVTAESQVLLHHASEALVRLYLGHEGRPSCPWLEVAGLFNFREFYDQLKRRFVDPVRPGVLERLVADVFLGLPENHPGSACTDEEWDVAVERLTSLLRHFATTHNESGRLYNSAKHGFAVNPANAAVFIGDDDGGSFGHSGPSLEFLESTYDAATKTRTWKTTTEWVRIRTSFAFIAIALKMLENLWSVAKAHYLEPSEGLTELWVPEFSPMEVMQSGGELGFNRFSLEVMNFREVATTPEETPG